jgi:hypothetical protein
MTRTGRLNRELETVYRLRYRHFLRVIEPVSLAPQ